MYDSQYGFRTEHSTELAALELIDRTITALDNNDTPFSIFLDLSKAFDTIDHQLLLNKLSHHGIKKLALKLLESYLTNLIQFIEYNGVLSSTLQISTGVPGSILGPLLFLIYINDIPQVSKQFNFIMFAADTTLFSADDTTLFSAADTTLFSTFQSFKTSTKEVNVDTLINNELAKISEMLKISYLLM